MKVSSYRIIITVIAFFFFENIANTAFCQDDEPINIEQQLENITEDADDIETEDDSYQNSDEGHH